MRKIVLATANPGKLRELQAVLAGLDFEIVPQSAFGVPEAEETGLTFIENALLKARNAANAALYTGLPALADDSGLAVDALGGVPGIYSARYAGADRANIGKLLAELEGVPAERRTARFVCVLALLHHPAHCCIIPPTRRR